MKTFLTSYLPTVIFLLPISLATAQDTSTSASQPEIVEVKKIWDQGPHNAFTDLIRFKDQWFCVFREGAGHVSPDGALRIIHSKDGKSWESAALITMDNGDLRDAKITVTPAGQLMLSGAAAMHDRSQFSHQSLAWFSDDGFQWSDPYEIGERDFWLWRTTWHGETAYSVGYAVNTERQVRLYRSPDGKQFDTLVENLFDEGYPNETSMIFEGDQALCLLRRDGEPGKGLIGTATAPFTDWKWQELTAKIGGPHMIRLANGQLIAAVRLYDGGARTSLCEIEPTTGKLTELLRLPSGGDSSYPGLVEHDGLLWVSYYSSHEGKTNIYLAKVKFPTQQR